jgi:hypothetical protein
LAPNGLGCDNRQYAAVLGCDEGGYEAAWLARGASQQLDVYELSAEVQGFRKAVQTGVVLRVNQTLEVNFSLQLGAVSEIVEVSGGVTLLDTQSANRAVTLDQQTVLDLPVNARNPFQFVHVNAGVIAVRTGISQATQDQNHNRFSMNGGRGQAGLTLIDGVPAAAVDWGGLIAAPSVDSVQEVNIQRNQFDAQFGKSDGGAVNMITRGGSNDFHGAVFEYLRNDKLDANSWANNRARAISRIHETRTAHYRRSTILFPRSRIPAAPASSGPHSAVIAFRKRYSIPLL